MLGQSPIFMCIVSGLLRMNAQLGCSGKRGLPQGESDLALAKKNDAAT